MTKYHRILKLGDKRRGTGSVKVIPTYLEGGKTASLRQIAAQIGITLAYVSYMANGKPRW